MQGVRKAVRSALNLNSAYPLSNINVWLSSKQEVAAGPVPVRRLAEATTVYVAVLGYTLIRTEQLPAAKELTDLIKTPALQNSFKEQLAEAGVVTTEQLAQLQVVVTVENIAKEAAKAIEDGVPLHAIANLLSE